MSRRTRDVWIVDAERGLRTRLTFDPRNDTEPIWAPDAEKILFNAHNEIHVKNASGAGDEGTMFGNEVNRPSDWSADGRFVSFSTFSSNNDGDMWILPVTGDRKAFPLLQTPFIEDHARFSPDGRWIAYVSNESGRNEVYVSPFNGAASAATASIGKWQVSVSGGNWPHWRRNGKQIFYLAADNKLIAVDVAARGAAFEVGAASPLFTMRPVAN